MTDHKENKDIFLRSIGKVKPLKKNNKNFKEPNPITIKKVKEAKRVKKTNNTAQTTDTSRNDNKNNLKIESSSIEKKLKKGRIAINKTVDFHGLSLEKAKRKFIKTIDECFYSEERCILFVTGKGMKRTNQDTTNTRLFYGRIREGFQNWIYEKDVVSKILNVVPAGFSYGGDGAFFVYLRKSKIKF